MLVEVQIKTGKNRMAKVRCGRAVSVTKCLQYVSSFLNRLLINLREQYAQIFIIYSHLLIINGWKKKIK